MVSASAVPSETEGLQIGWASADITPDEPVLLAGMPRVRLAEQVMDPVTTTALAIESGENEGVILVSCDLLNISDPLRDRVRERVNAALPDGETPKVVLSATHTHVAPDYRICSGFYEQTDLGVDIPKGWRTWGMELDAMSPLEYMKFAGDRIAEAAVKAWSDRRPGGISFGMSHAVIGHNRIMAYKDGTSRMYGATDRDDFSHVEGWEDHSVNLLFTWDREGELTGALINLASPSQHEGGNRISADFWYETRNELRARLGSDLFILPQCAAAGDKSQRVMIHNRAEQRMERLTGKGRRRRIAERIADAVENILPYMEENIEWAPPFIQRLETVELTRRQVSEGTYNAAKRSFERDKENYLRLRREIEENPEMREQDKWYDEVTRAYRSMRGASARKRRYHLQTTDPTIPVEVYVMRLGDMAMATTRHELYLDFGIRIQERSEAVQTFIVQLAGSGGYLAPERSVERGAYGSQVGQNRAGGPEGGRELVDHTLELIGALFDPVQILKQTGLQEVADIRLPEGGWLFRTDPDSYGRSQNWYDPELDDTGWQKVSIETSWQNYLESDYHGVAWYRRKIDSRDWPDWDRAFLHFEAVDEQAWVWVNGKFVGSHAIGPEGWDEFFLLEVADALEKDVVNHITVRTQNTVGAGGIWRPVRLRLLR